MTTTPLLTFDLDRTYRVPPERVWAALTEADLLRQWVCPDPEWTVSECTVDARPGGGYAIRFGPRPSGDAYRETATFTAFSPVHRLELDILTAGDDMSKRTRGVIRLEAVAGGTRLDLTIDGLSDADTADTMRTGWQWCLAGIAGLLEPAS